MVGEVCLPSNAFLSMDTWLYQIYFEYCLSVCRNIPNFAIVYIGFMIVRHQENIPI